MQAVRAFPVQGQLRLIPLTRPSFKQLITHRHTIRGFTAQSSPDGDREGTTAKSQIRVVSLQQITDKKKTMEDTSREKTEPGTQGARRRDFITKPATSILLESKLIFTLSSGLARSQNLTAKLFVSSIPNKRD